MTYTKKKRYNKKYPSKSAKPRQTRAVAIPRATMIHKKQYLKFVYDKTYNVLPDATSINPSIISFHANSIKQPGPQALHYNGQWGMQYGASTDDVQGFDHWMYSGTNLQGKYRQFVVLSSKCSVNVSPIVNVEQAVGSVYNQAILHKSTATGIDIQVGDSMAQIQQLPFNKVKNFKSSETETQGVNLSCTYSAKKMNGVKDVLDNPNFQGDASSNPAEQDYYTLVLGTRMSKAPDGSPAVLQHMPCLVRVKIEYNVILREPNTAINEATGEGWTLDDHFNKYSAWDSTARMLGLGNAKARKRFSLKY
jgi:hypothetical protein